MRRIDRATSLGDFFLLAPLHESDHPVEEGLSGIRRDGDANLPGQDPGSSGDAGAVAPRLPDHRGRLPGDGRLIDAGHPLEDLAVGGDELPGHDEKEIALPERGPRNLFGSGISEPPGRDLGAGGPEALGLGLPLKLRQRFGVVGKEERQPQPQGDHRGEEPLSGMPDEGVEGHERGEEAPDLHQKHHGISPQTERVQHDDGLADGREMERGHLVVFHRWSLLLGLPANPFRL